MPSTKEDKDEIFRRVERVYDVFGVLREKRNQTAGDLSGGQQQMLAFGMGLMHEPEVLLIDELSLGLATVVVQKLLEVVEQLKATGLTMIIVEQSLNVTLSVAERAVFMEKGRGLAALGGGLIISGFVPFNGQVEALGRDISRLPSYRRHRGGLGRGFQHAKIYPDLTVREALVVVIEHDMPLVMSISDRVYCLEAGSVISEGSPDEVRNDPLVIAS